MACHVASKAKFFIPPEDLEYSDVLLDYPLVFEYILSAMIHVTLLESSHSRGNNGKEAHDDERNQTKIVYLLFDTEAGPNRKHTIYPCIHI